MRTQTSSRTLFQTTILVLLFVPCLFANVHISQAQDLGTGNMEDAAGTLTGRTSDLVLDLGSQDAAEITGYLSLPDNSTVVAASMSVIPGPGAAAPAALGGDGLVHPEGPRVDVGADGTVEWMFDGEGYGEAGHQSKFGNGAGDLTLQPGAQGSLTWSEKGGAEDHAGSTIRLPKNANIDSARLLLVPNLRTDWWNTSWQRRVPIDIQASDDDVLPMRVERQVRIGPFFRDPVPELRLTMVENGTERPHAFWVRSSSMSRVTIGFETPAIPAGKSLRFYLYYDNPLCKDDVRQVYSPGPIDVLFSNEDRPAPGPSVLGPVRLDRPYGISQAANGTVLVADTWNHRVVMLDTTGRQLSVLGMTGAPGCDNAHFMYPLDVTTDGSGRVLVADTWCHRVQLFEKDGKYIRTIGTAASPGSDGSHFNFPWAVVIDGSGQPVVSDNGNDRVQGFFDASATWALWTLGRSLDPGADSSRFDSPRGLAYKDGYYIADAYNQRVQFFADPEAFGAARSYGVNRLTTPTDVAVGDDRVYVSDADEGKVLVLNGPGYFLDEIPGLSWPMGLYLGPLGDLWISDSGASRIVRVVKADLFIGEPEHLSPPADLTLRLNGRPLASFEGPVDHTVPLEGLEGTIMNVLASARCGLDSYMNQICDLQITVDGQDPGAEAGLTINGLDIRYRMETRMSVALAAGTIIDEEGKALLPVKASSRNGGRILLTGLDPTLDRPPFPLPSLPVPAILEGARNAFVMDLDDSFTDEGPMTFSIELLDGPAGATAVVEDGNCLLIDISSDQNSTAAVTILVTARDIRGQRTDKQLIIPVENIQDPPVILPAGTLKAQCGQPFSVDLEAVDGDQDELVFYLIDGPVGMALDRSGALNWTSPRAFSGQVAYSYGVMDGTFEVGSEGAIEVLCDAEAPRIKIDSYMEVVAGQLLVLNVTSYGEENGPLLVELLRAPHGMHFDTTYSALHWSTSTDDIGVSIVELSVSDGGRPTLKTCHIEVLRPRPWVRLISGPDKVDGRTISFSGKAGGLDGTHLKVQYRIDDGGWTSITASGSWSFLLDISGMAQGKHSLEVRAFDGDYSEPIHQGFLVVHEPSPATITADPMVQWALFTVIVVALICIGGVAVIRSIDGYVFHVERGPDGPTICVPVGERALSVGGKCSSEDEAEDCPDQPPRQARCFVCLGHIKSSEDFLECPRCGRVYHKSCAKRIKACPICGSDLVKEEN